MIVMAPMPAAGVTPASWAPLRVPASCAGCMPKYVGAMRRATLATGAIDMSRSSTVVAGAGTVDGEPVASTATEAQERRGHDGASGSLQGHGGDSRRRGSDVALSWIFRIAHQVGRTSRGAVRGPAASPSRGRLAGTYAVTALPLGPVTVTRSAVACQMGWGLATKV